MIESAILSGNGMVSFAGIQFINGAVPIEWIRSGVLFVFMTGMGLLVRHMLEMVHKRADRKLKTAEKDDGKMKLKA